jgi:hemolysin activation/secretion protein
VDEGAAARAELVALRFAGGTHLAVRPYLFAAIGAGRINRPALGEPPGFLLGATGLGARADLARPGLRLAIEYAHGFADYHPLDRADRLSLSLNLHV